MPVKTKLTLHKAIKVAMDGRTQIWLSEKAKINKTELSRKMTGQLLFNQGEIDRINDVLKTDFTL